MLQQFGQTNNFTVQYETTLPNSIKRAGALLPVLENEFSILCSWFKINTGFGPTDRVTININQPQGSGAFNYGYSSGGNSVINLDAQDSNLNDTDAGEKVKVLFVLEFVEILMSYNNQQGPTIWRPGDSIGEGLSHLCGLERYPEAHKSYYLPFVNNWLQTNTRTDYVSNAKNTDRDKESYGCSLLFLYYLKSQLGKSVPKIIQNGGANLEKTYQNLTGNTNGFAAFSNLVQQYLPIGNTPLLETDDPFPFLDSGQRYVWIDYHRKDIASFIYPPIASGTAIRGFLGCQPKNYHYDIKNTPTQLTCTAKYTGFAQPNFNWRVNGQLVTGFGTTNIVAGIYNEDPSNPQGGVGSTQAILMDYSITTTTFHSELVVTFPNTHAIIDLIVELDASERFSQPADISVTSVSTQVPNERVAWEAAYYIDLEKCSSKFRHKYLEIAHPFDWMNWAIAVILTLPDPPPIERIQTIRQLIDAHANKNNLKEEIPTEAMKEFEHFMESRLSEKGRLIERDQEK